MPKLMADANADGQLRAVVDICVRGPWREFWLASGCVMHRFEELGLSRRMTDRQVWQYCEKHQIMLFTANRNCSGPDSLEATLRELMHPESLPVLTVADARRLMRDRAFAERAADKLMDVLIDLDRYRGTGRVYLP